MNVQPRFRTRAPATPVAKDPERLYDDLPRRPGAPDALWAHQADVLRTYHSKHLSTADLALELPTGAGKTLPALLIAEWRRRSLGQRVLYACPTQQLARQTAEAALLLGIEHRTLVGSHNNWSTADKSAYESGRTLGIVTYNTVFNARPALEPAQTLLFDDAHAAEQYVAGSFSVDVNRLKRPELYQQVLDVLAPALSGLTRQALADDGDAGPRSVQMVSIAQVRRLAPRLARTFRDLGKEDPLYWSAEGLAGRLDRCQVYVAWDGILVRPVLPPTGGHRHFAEAEQRLYISATLGEGGELERSFGRAPISRLPVPEGWDTRGAGRRFFVFPDLQPTGPPRTLAADLVTLAGKGLVLAPSKKRARAAADLAPAGAAVLGPDGRAEALLSAFRSSPSALLTLAGRFDGLDLPGTQCRLTVLDGMPSGAHLQERFLSETLLAGRVLRERTRTRVVQGAGRCTRGLSDHSVVVVLGDALTRFLTLPEVHDALRPELQAEVDFGLDNSEADPDEVLGFARSFLDQDRAWIEEAEPALREARNAAVRTAPPDSAELAAAAIREVRAVAALWAGDWAAASREALEAAGQVRSAHLAGYRALWTYLAAAWLAEEAEERDDQALRTAALDLLRKAHVAGRGTSWLRQVQPLPADDVTLDPADEAAVQAALRQGPRRLPGGKWADQHTRLLADLAQTEAVRFEGGLTALGRLLGADAYKPDGPGRTDSAWAWPSGPWWALEAKTEEKDEHPVSQTTVRQANDQLKTLAFNRDEPVPDGSAVLIVSGRRLVDPTAAVVAEAFLHLLAPGKVLQLATDTVRAWKEIRAQAGGMSEEDAAAVVRRVFRDNALLSSDVATRLLADPVRG